jgi:hypothetical protein
MKQIKILAARRAYEFRPDDLRLTVLSVTQIHQQIQQYFSFQVVQVATPLQTFGPIPNTLPPGVVFDFGTTQTPDNVPTPIRFLHFEPTRIVVDVAGPSSAIDWTFTQLQNLLAEIEAPDGSPLMGEPERMRDYSELSVRYGFGLEELVSGPLFEVAEEVLKEDGQDILPLGVKFGTVAPDEEPNPGQIASINFSRGHQLEYRAGTRLEEGMFFSSAELSTDMHVDWLEALGRKVAAAKGE